MARSLLSFRPPSREGADYRTAPACAVPRGVIVRAVSAVDASPIALPFPELRAALDERRLSAAELTDAYLERIAHVDPVLHGYVVVDADGARADAERADRDLAAGRHRGPLHGIPISVKDHFPVAGLRMRMGSGLYDVVPREDADLVARARTGGAVVLGKNGMHAEGIGEPTRTGELASGEHPYNPAYAPGGSSSGTAVATAGGLCVIGVGGDSGGSVRGPAASCGVVGLKPTYGCLASAGSPPFMWSADHMGLFARDVAAVAAGMEALGGCRDRAPGRAPRLRVLGDDTVDPEVAGALAALRGTLSAAGASLGTCPPLDLAGAGPAWLARAKEAWCVHALGLTVQRERYSAFVRAFLDAAGATSAEAYAASWRYAERFRAEVDAALEGSDAILLPATPSPGLRWEQWGTDAVYPWYRFLLPFNLGWHPAITLPCALSADGMPIAYQLVGRQGHDETLLAVARWCEQAVGFDTSPRP
jgi:aspartyl-tRNA(Asn)/glutamyl-tRNA(Gln) amidotransferase subunit A